MRDTWIRSGLSVLTLAACAVASCKGDSARTASGMSPKKNADSAAVARRFGYLVLPHLLGDHLDAMSQTQREIIVEAFFEGRKGANIAGCRGIRMNTCDTNRKAAFHARRHSTTTVADFSTEIDLPD